MKYYVQILVLLVLAYAAVARVTPRNKFEEGLLKVIDKCIKGDVKSLPVPLPSLKSLNIPSMKIYSDGYTMSLREVKIKGLENLMMQKLSASPSRNRLSLEFFIPTLAVRADRYHLRGKAMLFYNINDKGVLKCNIKNLKIHADVQFGARGKNTILTALNLHHSVGDKQVHLSGSNSLVTLGVNRKLSGLINDNEVRKRIKNDIIKVAHEYLRGHTPQEFVKIISAI